MDSYTSFKSEWLDREKFGLTPLRIPGIMGRVFVETRFPDETGDRTEPYLYYYDGEDVAEFSVEPTPRLIRGRIDNIEPISNWIAQNIKALLRHWNGETGSIELCEELHLRDC